MIAIGQIIKNHCRQQGTSLSQVATRLKLNHTTLYKNINQNDMPLTRLYAISRFLNHNFFIYFIQNTASNEEKLLKLTAQNKELTSKVTSLQKENILQQEIISLLKSRQT
jgi:transcriptional regulator with XRE-family HTH domain